MELTLHLGSDLAGCMPTSRPLRVRPGERAVWFNASPDREEFASWRQVAANRSLPVDAVVALALELALVLDALAQAVIPAPAQLVTELVAGEPRHVAPTPALRLWEVQLRGGLGAEPVDELPEVTLPLRLIAQLPHGKRLGPLLAIEIDLARQADLRAARAGLTMESWVLRRALRQR